MLQIIHWFVYNLYVIRVASADTWIRVVMTLGWHIHYRIFDWSISHSIRTRFGEPWRRRHCSSWSYQLPPASKFCAMSRRSQRIRSRGIPESNVHQVISEEPESTPKLKAVRKPTRRSTQSSKMQRKLKQLLDMPLEVILEVSSLCTLASDSDSLSVLRIQICGHLLPKDLLNLSRTSKGFHSLLMSRRSQSIWKAVCLNLPGLPPCPPDLTEPAYINLIFDAHCHVSLSCNRDNTYEFR